MKKALTATLAISTLALLGTASAQLPPAIVQALEKLRQNPPQPPVETAPVVTSQALADALTEEMEGDIYTRWEQDMWEGPLSSYVVPASEDEARDVAYLAHLVFWGTKQDPERATEKWALNVLTGKGYDALAIRRAGLKTRLSLSGAKVRFALDQRR